MKQEPDSKAERIDEDFADDFFDSKVLDPAMGSGHFLVEAVDFITDKTWTSSADSQQIRCSRTSEACERPFSRRWSKRDHNR